MYLGVCGVPTGVVSELVEMYRIRCGALLVPVPGPGDIMLSESKSCVNDVSVKYVKRSCNYLYAI